MKSMIFCATLLALAAPLRAGEAAWRNSADLEHVVQVPAGWTAGAALRGLTPKGMKHEFTLMPGSRAFALDIAAGKGEDADAVSAADRFAKARKAAGQPQRLRAELADKSLFEYFKAVRTVKGRTDYSIQGILNKHLQRYYVTFSSARGFAAGEDWDKALQALGSLAANDPSVSAWKDDLDRKTAAPAPAGRGGSADLNAVAALRADGSPVNFNEIEVFACRNIPNNRYLLNADRTRHCWIVSPEDYRFITGKLGGKYWGENTVFFEICPDEMEQEKACVPAKLRNF